MNYDEIIFLFLIAMLTADNTPYEKIGNNEPVSIVDEIPFDIPDNWEWVRLENLYKFIDYRGSTPNKINTGIPLITAKNVRNGYIDYRIRDYISKDEYKLRMSRGISKKNDILFTTEAPMGYVALADIDTYSAGQRLITLQQYTSEILLSNKMMMFFMMSPFFQEQLKEQCTGTTVKGIKADRLKRFLIPVPPIEEQLRINGLLDKVFPIIKRYDDSEVKRKFLNNVFPELLKKSILQQAIQGKLIPQDLNDEPARILVERIRAEKERLIAEGKIKRDKNESVIYRRDNSHYEKVNGIERCIDVEIPFDIPDSWVWSRLSSICSLITDGEHKTPHRITSFQGYYLLSARNIRDGELSLEDVDYVDEKEYSIISKRCNPQKNDILISCSGSIGRICTITDNNNYVMVRSAAMVSPIYINSSFLMYELQSEVVQAQIKGKTKQAVQANLFQGAIRELLIAVPPLKEQHRIVEKIGEITPMIKAL